jgi:F0F1-type ATP synthase membrane subunit b/b'
VTSPEQIRAATREANVALAEMKDVVKELRALRGEVGADARKVYEAVYHEVLDKRLDVLRDEIAKTQAGIEDDLRNRIKTLAQALENDLGSPSTEDIIKAIRALEWILEKRTERVGVAAALIVKTGGVKKK